jgi:hypothetical protein
MDIQETKKSWSILISEDIHQQDSDGQFVLKLGFFMIEGHLVKCHGVKVIDF